MKKFKKLIKILSIICLIFLASMEVGLGGAAPILPKNRIRLIDTAVKTELVEAPKETFEITTEIKN
jgi:hypothetical protein